MSMTSLRSPSHWPGFDRPASDAPSTTDQRDLLALLRIAHERIEERSTMSLLMFDDATMIDVTMVPTDGPHAVWDDETVAWLLPMLGPTACMLLPRLYGIAAGEKPQLTDDISFACGVGRGQMARALDRLSRFHAVDDVDVRNDTIQVRLRTHLSRVSDKTRATWPEWYAAAYDLQFPIPAPV